MNDCNDCGCDEVEEVPKEATTTTEGTEDKITSVIEARMLDEEEDRSPLSFALTGPLDEKSSSLILANLLAMKGEPKNSKGEQSLIEFYINTPGGNGIDMFAIYDLMNHMKKEGRVFSTVGLGSVMSAGVLLLAAGTKGHRKIGRYCRVMLHGVQAAVGGSSVKIKATMEEVNHSEEMYVKALLEETSLTEQYLRSIVEDDKDVYVSAEEAIKLGIADEIL